MDCNAALDNSFGPQYCDQFDFTLLFEQTIFQILPCTLLVIIVPLRALQLRRQKVKTSTNLVKAVKIIAVGLFATTQLALIIAWSVLPGLRTKATISASVLSFVAALALLYLSNIEHNRCVHPSSTIGLYILCSLLLDIPQFRTLWLRCDLLVLPSIFAVGMLAKTLVLYLETRSKRGFLLSPYKFGAPEALGNIYNRVVLWWLIPLLVQGYRSTVPLNNLSNIDTDLTSNYNAAKFHKLWLKRKYLSNHVLVPVCD
jgi:ATP-binding cassette subfamily C (CFTR/MRP) protein 1